MIGSVILRHEVLRRLPKLLVVTFSLSTLILGVVNYLRLKDLNAPIMDGWFLVLAQFCVFLSAALVLMMPEAGRRCRVWELSLPVPGRIWWQGHFLSLLLGGTVLMLVFAIIPLLVRIPGDNYELGQSLAGFLLDLWGPPFLAYVLTLEILTIWRPAAAMPGREKGWVSALVLVLVLVTALMILVSRLGLSWWLFGAIVVLGFFRHRVRVPDTLYLPEEKTTTAESGQWSAMEAPSTSRWVLHKTIMRQLFKWPINWIALLPFIAFFGLLLGGFNPFDSDMSGMRFANYFMTIYILAAASGHFTEKMHHVDHLPVDRRTILAWLVLPSLLALAAGYAGGQWWASGKLVTEETIAFVNDEKGYGLKVPPRCFELVKSDEAPVITSPWGESHQAESVVAWKGQPWLFYKPFSTPEGASEQFVAWQISQVVQRVFGEFLSPEEISERYLETGSDGRVLVGADGLSLKSDHPQWRELSGGPVFPLFAGPVVILYLLVLALLFRLQRRPVSVKRQRVAFWGVMILLLVLHIGWMAGFVSGMSDDWIVSGIILGGIQRLAMAGSGTGVAAYAVVSVLVVFAWSLALRQFRRLEAL
jgi:hypothetical protein